MSKWREGERAKIVDREVTEDDRKSNRYFRHMAGLVGTIQNIYNADQIAVRIDPDSLGSITGKIHQTSTKRMREKFIRDVSSEQRKNLTKEEIDFEVNFMLVLRSDDLEPV